MGRRASAGLSAAERREQETRRKEADALARSIQQGDIDDPALLDEYAQHSWSHVRAATAASPHTRPETVGRLAFDMYHSGPREAALRNPNCPVEVLVRAAASKRADEYSIAAIMGNPNRTGEVVDAVSRRRISGAQRSAAADPLLPVARLKTLGKSTQPKVAIAAMLNPNHPDPVSIVMNADEDLFSSICSCFQWDFMYGPAVASMPAPVIAAIEARLLADTEFTTYLAPRWAVHPQATASTLTALVRMAPDNSHLVRAVLRHANCTTEVFEWAVYHSGDPQYAKAAVQQPACPEELRVFAALGE